MLGIEYRVIGKKYVKFGFRRFRVWREDGCWRSNCKCDVGLGGVWEFFLRE